MADSSDPSWKKYLEELAQGVKRSPQNELGDRNTLLQYNAAMQLPTSMIDKINGLPSSGDIALRIPKIQSRVMNSVHGRIDRANAQAQRGISEEFSNSSINGIVREQRYNAASSTMSASYNGMPWEELQSLKRDTLSGINTFGGNARAAAGSMFGSHTASNPNNLGRAEAYSTIGTAIQYRNIGAQQLAAISQQEEFRKSQGMDPRSREDLASKYYGQARQQQLASGILRDRAVNITDAGSGESRSIKLGNEVISELENQLKAITENFKKLETASTAEAEAIRANTGARMDAVQKLEVAKELGGGGRFGGMSERGSVSYTHL